MQRLLSFATVRIFPILGSLSSPFPDFFLEAPEGADVYSPGGSSQEVAMKLAALAVVLLFAGCSSSGGPETPWGAAGFDLDMIGVSIVNESSRYVFVHWEHDDALGFTPVYTGPGFLPYPIEREGYHDAIAWQEGAYWVSWSYDLESWSRDRIEVRGYPNSAIAIPVGLRGDRERVRDAPALATFQIRNNSTRKIHAFQRAVGSEKWYLTPPLGIPDGETELFHDAPGAYEFRAAALFEDLSTREHEESWAFGSIKVAEGFPGEMTLVDLHVSPPNP